ncbi:MAG: DUF4157 domain-containing protein, partial [Verrucomicrobiota bacterium]
MQVQRGGSGPRAKAGFAAAGTSDFSEREAVNLPNALQDRFEQLSGVDLSGVRVHYDSDEPRRIGAKAVAQGEDIFLGPNQEELLAHEAWHVVQQAQNRVESDTTIDGEAVNRCPGLEREAEAMGNGVADLHGSFAQSAEAATSAPAAAEGVMQCAGLKFGYAPAAGAENDHAELVRQIQEVIEAERARKRQHKTQIEEKKDLAIAAADDTEQKREALRVFVREYETSGWNRENLVNGFRGIEGITVEEVAAEEEIRLHHNNVVIFTLYHGDERFVPAAEINEAPDIENDVYFKQGTQKQYVRDARGTFIPRFATRGSSTEQMQQLFCDDVLLPRNQTRKIGNQNAVFNFGLHRGQNDEMNQKELEFVQLRDGSGENQRFLSVTHVKGTRKIFGNHGDEFTSESVMRIDLAKVPRELIFNQHMEESKNQMVSLPKIKFQNNANYELGRAQYSATKNRETLLSQVPAGAVDEVKIGVGNWTDSYQAKLYYNSDFRTAEKKRLEKEEKKKKAKEEREKKNAREAQIKSERDEFASQCASGLLKYISRKKSEDAKLIRKC